MTEDNQDLKNLSNRKVELESSKVKHQQNKEVKEQENEHKTDSKIFGLVVGILIFIFIIFLTEAFYFEGNAPSNSLIKDILELLKASFFGATGYLYAKYKGK